VLLLAAFVLAKSPHCAKIEQSRPIRCVSPVMNGGLP
jgi:hypothetical protein